MKGKRCINNKKKLKKRKTVGIQWFTPSSRTSEGNKFSFIHKETKKKWNGLSLRTAEFWCFFLFLFGLFGHDPEFLEA